jgi:hypothetical protein
MIGQGGPNFRPLVGRCVARARHVWKARLLLALAFCAYASSVVWAEDLDLRIRVAWGGGAARLWDAALELSAGRFSEPIRLSMEPDSPGAMTLEGEQRLRLWQRSPSAYDGVDVSLSAPRDAQLSLRITPRDNAQGELRREIVVAELIAELENLPLDDRGNRLLIRRAPGDQLRVRFDRDSLVFAPGERFQLEVIPHWTGFATASQLAGVMQLVSAEGGDPVWMQTQELTVGADGAVPPIGPLSIPLPQQEGVYDLVLQLESKAPANPVRANPGPVTRIVQLVVIDDRAPPLAAGPPDTTDLKSVLEIDPASTKWWEVLKRPQLPKWLPGFEEKHLASGPLKTEKHGETRFVVLEPGGWRAFPLPLGWAPGPHVLEVAYATGAPQAVGISLVEPNPAGEVSPLGVDSGVVVAPRNLGGAEEAGSEVAVHRLVFWPRSDAPVLLLTNQRHDRPALVGRIRVLRGPERLPPAAGSERTPAPPVRQASTDSDRVFVHDEGFPQTERLLAAWFEKPLFPENFSAPEGLDEGTNRGLDDWRTFYLGALRMIEYLKSRGYNAVSVPVWCEGSALYPSRLLAPTPKYDTGALFVSGQDPRRKDVLEMLLRMCGREGIRVIPSLQFATPLPALEDLLRGDAAGRIGLEWINGAGAAWVQHRGAPRGVAPYYNPLDPRVQEAMHDVVRELVDRYGGHRAFGGVALQLGPSSYAQLPGLYWGFDDVTIAQFQREAGVQVPGEGEMRFRDREAWLSNEGRAAWLPWRAKRMAALYVAMGRTVGKTGPHARLYLAGADLSRCEAVEALMRPALPRRTQFAEAMLHVGLDPSLWKEQPNIVLPRPRRIAPLAELPHRAVSVEIDSSPDVTEFFAAAGAAAGLVYHETRPMRLEAFDEVSPFGRDKTYTLLAPQLSLHGAENRRRIVHLLARSDVQMLFEGGWMLALGQEDSLQPLLDVYRRLPAAVFDELAPTSASSQTVVVRQKSHGGKTWVYLVNDAPWPAAVELEIDAPPGCTLTRLTDRADASLERRGGRTWWKVELAPYDVAGAALSSPEAKVVDYLATPPPQAEDELRLRIREIGARAYQLRDPQAQSLRVLNNPGFEEPAPGGRIPGWEYRGAWESVTLDAAQAHDGRQSLRLRSPAADAPTWIRSDVISAPPSGRLTLSVWARTSDVQKQPAVLLTAQWMRDVATDYRWASFGANSPIPLTSEWREYLFHVPLPPAEVSQLCVGVKLFGQGEVWIDTVRLYQSRFEPPEQDELKKIYGGAEYDRDQGRTADCLHFLDGYWPQFLQEHVEPLIPRAAEAPVAIPAEESEKPSFFQRIRSWNPLKRF